jgi:hypothetical protein
VLVEPLLRDGIGTAHTIQAERVFSARIDNRLDPGKALFDGDKPGQDFIGNSFAHFASSNDRSSMASKILKVQARLAELGLLPASEVDGIDGKKTRAAVRAFQRLHGITADGLIGDETTAELWPAPIPERDAEADEAAVPPDVPMWPRQRDVERFYGPVGKNQTMLELPFDMRLAWEKRQKITRFSIHEKVHDSAKRCFERIANEYDQKARELTGIDLFGGCLNVRKMRGGNAWSMHAWGVAIDLDPARNQLRWNHNKARFALPDCRKLHQIFEDEGWINLGRARDYDWQHFQAARL